MGIGFEGARHLVSRAAFGEAPPRLRELAGMSRGRAFEALAGAGDPTLAVDPPSWLGDPPPTREMRRTMRQQLRKKLRGLGVELKGWWYRQMVASPTPLVERMTLLWHDHFTSSLRKARWPTLMFRQNQLFRRHALGSFRELLHAVARDPAMILYLDGQRSRRGKPNENFARELLELFTLGKGHYSEKDIKEAARAFTGWRVKVSSGDFHEAWWTHDHGAKTFMGRKGRLDGGDIIDIVLDRPEVATFIVEKLWRAFVSEAPDRGEVARLATMLRGSDYALRPVVRELLTSDAFYADAQRATMVKSPVDLLVGTLRRFGVARPPARDLLRAGRLLGQDLLEPPSVKGWPEGTAWITASTLVARQQLMKRAVQADKVRKSLRRERIGDWLGRPGLGHTEAVRAAIEATLVAPPVHPVPPRAQGEALASALLLDPTYQLK